MRLGILVSGRGSNLGAVLGAVADGTLPAVRPVIVISNRPGVRALSVAAAHGVPIAVARRTDYPDAHARDAAIGRLLSEAGAELALLAGYDQLLRGTYFTAFSGSTINIHPSLLPRHGGSGMMGLAVHRAVLAAGDAETGVTVHHVTPELDAGTVIAQVRMPVAPGETAEQLAERVLATEHELIVRVLGDLATQMAAGGASGSMTAAPRPPVRHAAAKQRTLFDA
ncbi:MAG TPA: phosphoribosylglycinamide formyltransferase [Candidatus Limnocylindrales bacterium]|nr:phosphoribosylglycinamide formyltransferase [Candidatus Limnocylindrales bacterium]